MTTSARDTNSHAETVIAMVRHLGGPQNIEPSDIEWANDIPAGRRLLEFFASQIVNGDVAASLRDIALEKEEIET